MRVDADGGVYATFTNGQSLLQGQVVMANFTNPNGLLQTNNTTWQQSFSSASWCWAHRAPGPWAV